MMDYLEQEVRKVDGLTVAKDVGELERCIQEGDPCVIHSVEGSHSLEDDKLSPLECLDILFDRGVAYLTLAHFYPNVCVESNVFPYPEEQGSHVKEYWKKRAVWDESGGLTETGREVVERMLELGMIIDITHLTIEGRNQVYDIVDQHDKNYAVIASHVGAFEHHALTYNLQDWELQWLADRGCCAGAIFMNSWLSPTKPTGAGLANIERTIKHMINVGGEGLPAIGTDFDGFTDPPDELTRIEDIGVLRRHLSHCGYTDERINAIMGGNGKRVLLEGWKR
jgi:membrane dipeptidase